MFSLNYVRVYVQHFIFHIFGLNTKMLHFLSFELHTIMYIAKYLVSSDEAVPVLINIISNFEELMRKYAVFAFTKRFTNSKNTTICTIQRSWLLETFF